MFCTVLVFRIQCMVSRSSLQDILTLFGTHSMSLLAQSPDFNLPPLRCLNDSQGVHLNRFRYANARNQRDLTSLELHQHSYKSFSKSIIAESSPIFRSTRRKDRPQTETFDNTLVFVIYRCKQSSGFLRIVNH